MTEKLEGQIERITFFNPDTGYTVARVRVSGRRDLVTVVGDLMSPPPGETLAMTGEWIQHPRFGRQFQAREFTRFVPASSAGIRKYLGSAFIKGVGPVMAERLVEHFGDQTLEIIEHQSERLLEVEGLGPKRLDMIRRAWAEQREASRVMVYLQDHGISPSFAVRIYRKYKDEALKIVRENPYLLAEDIAGIGFFTADQIGQSVGLDRQSIMRAQAGLQHALRKAADDGHMYLPYEELIARGRELLEADRDTVARGAAALAEEGKIVLEDLKTDPDDFAANNKAVYLTGYHVSEVQIARRLMALAAAPRRLPPADPERLEAWVKRDLSIELAPQQAEAVRRAASEKLLVVTGGPGTGKTTIIRAVLAVHQRMKAEVLLAAPTGRAAKRMSEASGHEAKTVHRLLEYNPMAGGFGRNPQRPLDCDLLVVDEASMLDTYLTHHLLKAVPPKAALILVGDVNQLPSVGAGQVLGDVIASGAASLVRLTQIFRQAEASSIVVAAHRINRGLMPESRPDRDLDDFYFIERREPAEALATILELVGRRIPERFGLDPVEDVQVLSPMHRGLAGASNLNFELQKALNPAAEHIDRAGQRFGRGDKVMQIRNNYDKEVFNGDIGRIARLDRVREEVIVEFDGRSVAYEYADLDELVPAYAVSVHKSQGSEYPAVVFPVLSQHHIMLQRNLIYTGVTRGRKLVVLVGDRRALARAVANNQTRHRYTRLADRLKGLAPLE